MLVSATILGALHALTPGHGKTLVAAYLVGEKGTKKEALLLGLATTVTHTSTIYLLGAISLFASKYFLPEKIIPAVEMFSALTVFGLGIYLLTKRLGDLKHSKESIQDNDYNHQHDHDESQNHSHDNKHSDQTHVHSVSELRGKKLSLFSLISLGFSGGIIPCADALAIMIVAINIGKIGLGMILILFFSIGLALVLVIIGMLMVSSKKLFEKFVPNSGLSSYFPILSALAIVIIGAVLLLKILPIWS